MTHGYCIAIKDSFSGDVLGMICDPPSKKAFSANKPVVFTLEDVRRRVDFLDRYYTMRCRRMEVVSRDFIYVAVQAEPRLRIWHMQRRMARNLAQQWGMPA